MSVFGDIVKESRYIDNKVYVIFDEENYRKLELKLNIKEQEIEKLNSIINNDFSKICREKMIDKLSANEMILLQNKEIERLNNIINEMEYWLRENLPIEEKQDLQIVLNKLQELKGSDKE